MELADEMVSKVLRGLSSVPDEVPDNLFKITVPQDGKRKRRQTDKMKESRRQNEEEEGTTGNKKPRTGRDAEENKTAKKAKKDLAEKSQNEEKTPYQKKTEKKKTEEKASLEEENAMLQMCSPMRSQFLDQVPKGSAPITTPDKESTTPLSETWALVRSVTSPGRRESTVRIESPGRRGSTVRMESPGRRVPTVEGQRCPNCTMTAPPKKLMDLLRILHDPEVRNYMDTFLSYHGHHQDQGTCNTWEQQSDFITTTAAGTEYQELTNIVQDSLYTDMPPLRRRSPRKQSTATATCSTLTPTTDFQLQQQHHQNFSYNYNQETATATSSTTTPTTDFHLQQHHENFTDMYSQPTATRSTATPTHFHIQQQHHEDFTHTYSQQTGTATSSTPTPTTDHFNSSQLTDTYIMPPLLRRSPRKRPAATATSSTAMPPTDSTSHFSSFHPSDTYTMPPLLRRSPRKRPAAKATSATAMPPTDNFNNFQHSDTYTSEDEASDLPVNQPLQSSSQETPSTSQPAASAQSTKTAHTAPEQMAPLLDGCPVSVNRKQLKKATKAASGHKSPGYSLAMKLMPVLFEDMEMALSRGQGLAPAQKDDIRPALNQEKCTAMKDYIVAWCKKYGYPIPSDKELNKAITEAVAYARKKVKGKKK